MKNKLIFFLLVLLPTSFASANGLIPCSGKDCTICHLFEVLQILFNGFIKYVLVYITLFLIIWAGFLIITDAGNNKNKLAGIQLLKKALIGIIIILTAWTVINTLIWIIAPKAVGPSGELLTNSWFKLDCTVYTSAPRQEYDPGYDESTRIQQSIPSGLKGKGGGFSGGAIGEDGSKAEFGRP